VEPFDALLRDALVVCAVLCFPVLGAAALIGLVVAVLQAATQIQEQTLTLLLGGRFGFGMCAALFTDALNHIPAILYALS